VGAQPQRRFVPKPQYFSRETRQSRNRRALAKLAANKTKQASAIGGRRHACPKTEMKTDKTAPAEGAASGRGALRRYWPRALFVLPVAAVLWVQLYNRIEPRLFGVPFFYWF
jgi:Protein of unknown function (DUF3311)